VTEQPSTGEGIAPGRISEKLVHAGRIVRLSLDEVRFPDGSVGTLEMIRHRGASAVLPLRGSPDDEDPEVILVRQYRYAADGYMYEVPAGMIDPGESWEDCARRELEEEAGVRAGQLRKLTHIYTTPGFTDEVIHLFLAWDLEEGAVDRDHDEFMEVVTMPMSRALAMVESGEIVDCKSVSTLLYAARFVMGGG
jgi:ADP-ribose pyrophosphatase